MPYARTDRDIRLMKEADSNIVRLGKPAWSRWEPADGRVESAWRGSVIDAMGTPIYAMAV